MQTEIERLREELKKQTELAEWAWSNYEYLNGEFMKARRRVLELEAKFVKPKKKKSEEEENDAPGNW